MFRSLLFSGLVLLASTAFAGNIYEVTSGDGKEETTYQVKFGGGRRFEMATAYDPASKAFVYLQWDRGTEKPKPVSSIWNHKTGETIALYKFPDVANPLPLIDSIDELKICPKTGGKILKKDLKIIFD